MGKPLDVDLRRRVVAAIESGMSTSAAARRFESARRLLVLGRGLSEPRAMFSPNRKVPVRAPFSIPMRFSFWG